MNKYSIIIQKNNLKAVSDDLVAFYHYQDTTNNRNLYGEISKIVTDPFKFNEDKYTVIHKNQVGYANLQFINPEDNNQSNENFYELYKLYLNSDDTTTHTYINDFSLFYEINKGLSQNNSLKNLHLNSLLIDNNKHNETLVLPNQIEHKFIKCSIIKLDDGKLEKNFNDYQDDDGSYLDYKYDPEDNKKIVDKNNKEYDIENDNTILYADDLLKELKSVDSNIYVRYYRINQNREMYNSSGKADINIFNVNIFDNSEICTDIIEQAKKGIKYRRKLPNKS